MKAGELRERVAFEKRGPSTNPGGGLVVGDWVEQFQCRAGFQWLAGSEPVIAQRLQGVTPVVITVRSHSRMDEVDTSWRIRDTRDGTLFNIRSAKYDTRGFSVDWLCDTGASEGG